MDCMTTLETLIPLQRSGIQKPARNYDIDLQSDFDGCLIKGPLPTINSHALLHIYAVGRRVRDFDIKEGLNLILHGFECVYDELRSKDNTHGLRCLAKLTQGVEFEKAVDYIIERIKLKESSLKRIRELFPDRRLVLGVISNNDRDLIEELNNRRLQYELERWGIVIDNGNIIGNIYPKEDGRYTGNIDVLVGPNKPRHFIGMPYLADFTDYLRYRHFPGVIKIC